MNLRKLLVMVRRLALVLASAFIISSHAIAQIGPGGLTPRPCVNLTDGTNTVNCASKITVSGGTVGGSNPNATLTVTGGSGDVTTGIPGQVATYTSTTQVGSSDVLTDTSVNIGIGTTAPATKLDVEGDLYLHTTPSHIYWTSANGSCWVETVDNNGNTNINSTTCPQPPNPINNNLTFKGNNLTFNGSQLTF